MQQKLEIALNWFGSRIGKVSYSMANRNGPNSYDCSSAVYYALKEAGIFSSGLYVGNTESMFNDLPKYGFTELKADVNGYIATKRGDVFIWGRRGASAGALGHTGMFTDADNIIHCAYGYNGIHIDNHDWLIGINGYPTLTVFRYTGTATTPSTPAPTNKIDQVIEVGSIIKFNGTYTAADIALIDNVWQVRSVALCPKGFSWADNGIPAGMVTEVDEQGYRTSDQELSVDSKFIVPGKYIILDVGQYEDRWLGLIEYSGLKFWFDLEPVEEIESGANGTPDAGSKPESKPEPVAPITPTPKTDTPETDTESEKEVETEQGAETSQNEDNSTDNTQDNNEEVKEEEKMAFSPEDIKALKIQTEEIQTVANEVAETDEVKEIVAGIPKYVKTIVYIVGDSLLGLGALFPSIAVAFSLNLSIEQIAAFSGMFGTAGGFLLTMFGIYKKNK